MIQSSVFLLFLILRYVKNIYCYYVLAERSWFFCLCQLTAAFIPWLSLTLLSPVVEFVRHKEPNRIVVWLQFQ